MRSQFLSAIQELCQRRSGDNSEIRWWFSQQRLHARRVNAEFNDESTRPFGIDALTPTVEDPPLNVDFWRQLSLAEQ